jgi:hypothetical protein
MKTLNHFPPGFNSEANNIAIDFDGVIHTFDKGYYEASRWKNQTGN